MVTMSSIKLLQKLKKKASSDDDSSEREASELKAKVKARKKLQSHPRYLQFDLFALLTYMSSISYASSVQKVAFRCVEGEITHYLLTTLARF